MPRNRVLYQKTSNHVKLVLLVYKTPCGRVFLFDFFTVYGIIAAIACGSVRLRGTVRFCIVILAKPS